MLNDRVSRVVQHKIELYLDYLELTKENIVDALHSPMPSVWNDTTGKAIEQRIKSLGG